MALTGTADGGTPVTSYEIWWDQGSSNWVQLQDALQN
jgi:hypothetical protein